MDIDEQSIENNIDFEHHPANGILSREQIISLKKAELRGIEMGMRCLSPAEADEVIESNIREAVKALYQARHAIDPAVDPSALEHIVIRKSPMAMLQALAQQFAVEERVEYNDEYLSKIANRVSADIGYGQHEAGYVAFMRFFRDDLGLKDDTKELPGLEAAAQHMGWYVMADTHCFVSYPQREIHLDGQERLHCTTGMAISWPDGWGVYALEGIIVPEKYVMRPLELTVDEINATQNAELRRVAVQQYNSARGDQGAFIKDSGAVCVDEAEELGIRLLRKDEEAWVEMKNSTPEPDGSYKLYYMRIDPTQYDGDAGKYAHAAIASTWVHVDDENRVRRDNNGRPIRIFKDWRDYAPQQQT